MQQLCIVCVICAFFEMALIHPHHGGGVQAVISLVPSQIHTCTHIRWEFWARGHCCKLPSNPPEICCTLCCRKVWIRGSPGSDKPSIRPTGIGPPLWQWPAWMQFSSWNEPHTVPPLTHYTALSLLRFLLKGGITVICKAYTNIALQASRACTRWYIRCFQMSKKGWVGCDIWLTAYLRACVLYQFTWQR